MDARDTTGRGRRAALGELAVFLALAAVVLLAHGGALWDGCWYDDHWHRHTLRAAGWNLHDLTEATTFDFPGAIVHLWWQTQPLQWRYPRPVTMFFMKLEYELTGGNPVGLHACGLAWHLLAAYLVYRLARWALGTRRWALAAAVLFVLNPNSAFAVSWSAARNAVISAFFLLAAVLAYLRASFGTGRTRSAATGLPAAAGLPLAGDTAPACGLQDGMGSGAGRAGWLLASIGLWVLALFARETAIVLPLLVALLDATYGGRRHFLRRLPWHALLLAAASAFAIWRLTIFPSAAAPDVYFQAPANLASALVAGGKLVQLIFELLAYLPLFTLDALGQESRRTALIQVIMLVLLLPGLIGYAWLTRGESGRWAWPGWVLVAFLPVVPVASMPHFGYLPAAGAAIGTALLMANLGRRVRLVAVPATLLGALLACGAHRVLWRGMFRGEQLVYADILATTPPPAPGSRLFFINLPINSTFATVALREAWGVEDLAGYVLTLAPHTFRMPAAGELHWCGPRELLVTAQEPGYFASNLERLLLRMSRPHDPLSAGQTVRGDVFDTTILAAGGPGITQLTFAFHAPLDPARDYIFVSTPDRPAARLRWEGENPGEQHAPTAPQLVELPPGWHALHAEALAERDRIARLLDRLEHWSRSLAK